ncbi:hypothetical protein MTR67_011992 [Solanum verrucosum]|uniref:Uncharacterized protein n=1 Tax=Solanum verrucosum TaxID=315347 RepID=A0AAF0TFL0_SOLVR|nr:hypothetical protein MTR67_011992 [Solanum verrucosum]
MAPFEVFYGTRSRSPIGWFEVGEVALKGPKLMHEPMEKHLRLDHPRTVDWSKGSGLGPSFGPEAQNLQGVAGLTYAHDLRGVGQSKERKSWA